MSFLRFVVFFLVLMMAHWGFAVSKPAAFETRQKSSSESDSRKNEKILLRYKFRTYEVLRYSAEHKSTIEGNLDGVRELTAHESKFKKHIRIVHVDAEGSALVEPVLDQVRMQVRFDKAKPTVYDSTSKEEVHPKFKHIEATIGRALVRMRISSTGELLKTTRLISKALQEKLGGGRKGKLAASDPSKNFLILLPKKALIVGDEWTDRTQKIQLEVRPGLKRDFTILKTYKLEKVENQVAKITFTSAIAPPVRTPDLQLQIVQLLPQGSIYFDIEKGRILERSLIIDKQIVGLHGGKGSMHVKTRRTERLVHPSTASRVDTKK